MFHRNLVDSYAFFPGRSQETLQSCINKSSSKANQGSGGPREESLQTTPSGPGVETRGLFVFCPDWTYPSRTNPNYCLFVVDIYEEIVPFDGGARRGAVGDIVNRCGIDSLRSDGQDAGAG